MLFDKNNLTPILPLVGSDRRLCNISRPTTTKLRRQNRLPLKFARCKLRSIKVTRQRFILVEQGKTFAPPGTVRKRLRCHEVGS